VIKRDHRDARQASTAAVSEFVPEVPLPLLIIRLPGQKETPKEPAQIPGKLGSLHTIFFSFFTSVINYFES